MVRDNTVASSDAQCLVCVWFRLDFHPFCNRTHGSFSFLAFFFFFSFLVPGTHKNGCEGSGLGSANNAVLVLSLLYQPG